MSELAEIQEKLLENQSLLLRVKATLLYPHIGGYSAQPFDPTTHILEPPRPTELKALWRWWARVILSTVYGGTKDYSYLDEKVAEILGSRGEKASKFIVRINNIIDYAKLQEHFVKIYKDKNKMCKSILEDLNNIFNDFANMKNVKCRAVSVNLASFKSIQVRFKGSINDLNNAFRKENIKLKIKNGKLNITPDKIDEIKNLAQIIKNKLNKDYQALISNLSKYFEYGKIARLFMISQKKRIEELAGEMAVIDACKSVEIVIDVLASNSLYNRLGNHEQVLKKIRFALYSFIVSLIFGSLGYASRRGFGSIVVEDISDGNALWVLANASSASNIIKEDIEYMKRLISGIKSENCPERIEASLQELLRRAVDIASAAYAGGQVSKAGSVFPKVPTLLLDTYFKFKVFKCKDPLQSLYCISEACLKNRWRNLVPQNIYLSDLHTWILGLPRGKEKGYSATKNRRPSAFHFKILKNSQGTFLMIYGFLSEDWPVSSLYHVSSHGRKPVMDRKVARPSGGSYPASRNNYIMLRNVFNAALEFIEKIVEDCCKGESHA
ncbi:MAG: type III-B CRISPR module RAMP protein Cmr1 [Thermofilum sp.]|jgi:CRISPR type III-B/RAMP module RAMP protein Cmr1|nr:type III-B CRISPR module RAMP protein Cmr1 [Thermofilum sp.]